MNDKHGDEEPGEKKHVSQLFLRIIGARNIREGGGHIDAYASVFLGKEKAFKTEVLKHTAEPSWETEKGKLFNLDEKAEDVRIVLKDANFLIPDSFVGQVSFSLASLQDGVPHYEWYPLESRPGKKDKVQGELNLQIIFSERPDGNIGQEDFATPIHTLLRKNKMSVLKAALEKSSNGLDVKDKDGNYALHVAALLDNADAVQQLLKKGADVKSKNDKGQTALHVAAEKSPASLAHLLEGKADVEAKDSDPAEPGKRPLHVAAASNNGRACTQLLEKGASVNAATEKGNTPLHLALSANAFEAVKVLASQRKADIYKKNKAGQHCAHLALKLGGDIKRIFMDSVNVEDEREFDIVDSGFRKRHRIEGDHLSPDFQKSNQFLLKTSKPTETRVICHYIGSGSSETVSKVGFCVVTTVEGTHTELSYQNTVAYGTQEPLVLNLEPNTKYALLPYSQDSEGKGRFSTMVFTKEEDEVELTQLMPWKNMAMEKGEWKGASAGGCNREDTFSNNPSYLLKLPSGKKELELYLLLVQQKSTMDIIPYQVHPYPFHIGFYVYNKDVDDIVERSVWQNAREVYKYFKVDTTKEFLRELVLVPSTVKPGQETNFTLYVYSDEPVTLERFKGAKIIDVNK